MMEEQVKAILERVADWPGERQRELAELALEIEAKIGDSDYHATADELAAIDAGLAGEAESEEEVQAAFATFRRG